MHGQFYLGSNFTTSTAIFSCNGPVCMACRAYVWANFTILGPNLCTYGAKILEYGPNLVLLGLDLVISTQINHHITRFNTNSSILCRNFFLCGKFLFLGANLYYKWVFCAWIRRFALEF